MMSAILKDCFSLSFQNMKGLGFECGKLTQPELLGASGSSQPSLEGLLALRCGVDRIDLTYSGLWEKVLGKFANSSWSIVRSHEIEEAVPALQILQIKHCITSGKCDNLNKGHLHHAHLGRDPAVEVVETRGDSNLYTSAIAGMHTPFVRPDSKPEPSDNPALAAFDTKADRNRNFGCCYWL
jgi:hypothetical protein